MVISYHADGFRQEHRSSCSPHSFSSSSTRLLMPQPRGNAKRHDPPKFSGLMSSQIWPSAVSRTSTPAARTMPNLIGQVVELRQANLRRAAQSRRAGPHLAGSVSPPLDTSPSRTIIDRKGARACPSHRSEACQPTSPTNRIIKVESGGKPLRRHRVVPLNDRTQRCSGHVCGQRSFDFFSMQWPPLNYR